jgi:hypothetical protein
MPSDTSNTLSLDQSYQAAFLWFDHKGDSPDEISEPAHGSVQLVTDTIFARVRWSDKPVEQSSVLALLQAAPDDKRLVIFSVSGFTAGAVSVAESQGISLYTFDATGIAVAKTTHARSMAPTEPQEPPFPPPEQEGVEDPGFWARANQDDADEDVPVDSEYVPELEANANDWTDCPSCGTTQFKTARFCRSCGTHLESGVPHSHNATATELGLRCRTCDSTDIAIGDHSA